MTVRELINKIGFKVDQGQAKKAEKSVKKMSTKMKLAIGSVVAGVLWIGKSAISAAADMEMLTTQFEVMLGSTEAANDMMQQLRSFAASTPFALEDLAKGTQTLLSYKVSSEDVLGVMRMLGDTAQGNSENLKTLSTAFGRITADGKATGETLNMIQERGIGIYSELAEMKGTTVVQLRKMVSAGQISAADVKASFERMTSEGGMFFQGMEKQSKTFLGLVSTMKDNFKDLLAEVGSALLPVMKEVVEIITKLVQGPLGELIAVIVNNLTPVLQMLGQLLGPLFEALIPVFMALNAVIKPFIEILTGILLPVLQAVVPLFQVFSEVFLIIGEILTHLVPLFQALGQIIFFVVNIVVLMLQVLMPLIEVIGWIIGIVADILTPIFAIFADLLSIIFSILEPLMPLFVLFGKVLSWVAKILGVLLWPIKIIVEGIKWVVDRIKDLVDWIMGEDEDKKKKEEDEKKKSLKPTTLKMKASSLASNMKGGMKGGNVANVNMTNNVGVNAQGNIGSKAGAERVMKEAAKSVFTVELQKILINSGY
ncbi:MAG: tape measure protein [Nitrosopumilaceae archaeon]|jgi:tape measure domain-containing protein